jgi:hypothetical protein
MLIDHPPDRLAVILLTLFLRVLHAVAERPELWSTL